MEFSYGEYGIVGLAISAVVYMAVTVVKAAMQVVKERRERNRGEDSDDNQNCSLKDKEDI